MPKLGSTRADLRGPSISAGLRSPSQGRGLARFEALLDACDNLLEERASDEVTLAQIARRAKVPTTSVYHFFPTKEAMLLGLAQRHLQGFNALCQEPVAYDALSGWQDFMAWDLGLVVGYYHRHPPAMRLFLGGYGGPATQQANDDHNALIAQVIQGRLNAAFHMPSIPNGETVFQVTRSIIDSVLGASYARHGRITDEHQHQAHEASVAYCRLYLQEHVELREDVSAAMARGEPIVLRRDLMS